MSRRAEFLSAQFWLLLVLATLAALARALPAPQDDDANAGPLPFLQFTKGGIRVNFGGYHAQAGLGGLLTGSKADGGLHASAGTPSGAHASAGLGGSLDDGPMGGLHARAGLGNGGPEAEAGLGGTLAGPRPRGELYAGSSPGGYATVLDRINGIEGSEKSKNIQVIARPKKASDQNAEATSSGRNEETPSSSSASSSASANAGVSGSAGEGKESWARQYFLKRLHERAGPYYTAEVSTRTPTSHDTIASHADKAEAAPERAATTTTTTTARSKTSTTTAQSPPAVPRNPNRPKLGIFARAVAGADGESESQSGHRSTLFDDIFNIPISALNAVNKLLKNHVGRK